MPAATRAVTQPSGLLTLDLQENADWIECDLAPAHSDVLSLCDLVDIRPAGASRGTWALKARNSVGAATLESAGGVRIDLRIVPKVGIDRLLFMMGYAADAKGWRSDWIDLPEVVDIPEAAAESLVRLVDRALNAGLMQGYIRVEESALTIRGRIREVDQVRRRFGQMIPIEITYDEFTTDIAENQILKAAIRRLLRIRSVQPATRCRLLRCLHRFADVSDLVSGTKLPRWQPSRLNARYVPALRLAEIVLAGSSFDLARGGVRASGFMVSMPTVFEDFVTKALGAAIDVGSGGHSVLQDHRWRLDSSEQIRLRPDLVWYSRRGSGAPGLVVDAKYKAARIDGFPNADVYQMLAYCTSLGLSEGHLVYAAGNERGGHYRIPNAGVGGAGVDVHAHALDLAQSPEALLTQIAGLARAVLGVELPPRQGGAGK